MCARARACVFFWQCVAMNIEGWLKNGTPHVVYTQIWLSRLSLPMDDRHLSCIKKFIKKNPVSRNSTPPFKQPFFF